MIEKLKSVPRRWLIGGFLVVAAVVIWGALRPRPYDNRWLMPDGSIITLQKTTRGKQHAYVTGGPLNQVRLVLSRTAILSRLGLKAPVMFAQNRPTDSATFWFRLQGSTNRPPPVYQTRLIEKSTGLVTRATALSCFSQGAGQYVIAATFENYPWHSAEATVQLELLEESPAANKWLTHQFPIGKLDPPAAKTAAAPKFSVARELDKTWRLQTVITGVTGAPTQSTKPATLLDSSIAIFMNQADDPADTNWMPARIEGIGTAGSRFQATGISQRRPSGELSLLFQEVIWPTESPWLVRAEFVRVSDFTAADLWTYRIANVRSVLTGAAANGNLATNQIHGWPVRIISLQPGSQPGQGLLLSIQLDGPDTLNLSLVHARTGPGNFIPVHLVATSGGTGTALKVFGLGPPAPDDTLELLIATSTNRSAEFTVTPEFARGRLP